MFCLGGVVKSPQKESDVREASFHRLSKTKIVENLVNLILKVKD